jgi:hypothetical protein
MAAASRDKCAVACASAGFFVDENGSIARTPPGSTASSNAT